MRTLVLISVLTLAASTALADPVIVKNGAEPAHGVQQLHMEEMWRVGGADDEENFFGLITLAEMGPDGLVYVMDAQLCQVFVYDDEGTLVKTLFRQGDGPGEIRQPRDMVIMPDGSVGLVQEFRRALDDASLRAAGLDNHQDPVSLGPDNAGIGNRDNRRCIDQDMIKLPFHGI